VDRAGLQKWLAGYEPAWRDLWVIRFDQDGRCVEFVEWPIAPPGSERDDGA
jgi:hypothetical protein